ncbi:hypothetical protein E1B28_007583 [Marasmius oreades]|uniref:DUF1753-domain-containing protein n=1 Tax=Marasmius oreades TaxID=181124 RepID=A0A9P7UU65_9AGAR|nr:uncharacterized protein E1B28_007583 [Marasmius oreades]KAG7093950.1 hypothetical protein E1B28_007583 [Marasmius oreades]
MRLMLRPEWRLWPLSSCLGILDLKTAVSVALFFVVFNKVAGVYGLIALLTGAGGSFSQLSLYVYSVLALVAFVWGIKAVKEEDPQKTLYFAHLFFADHMFSTAWTVYFFVVWWFQTPHDGQQSANSPAQIEIIDGTEHSKIPMTDQERVAAAQGIWNHEKDRAAAFIILSWLVKIYLALLIYSYASHLRKGTYRSSLRNRAPVPAMNDTYESALGYPEEDEALEDIYRFPPRTPNTANTTSDTPRKYKVPGLNGHSAGEHVIFDQGEQYASSSRSHARDGSLPR